MIHGLSEQRRMNRLGKLRLGIIVDPGGGKRPYPQSVNYFVCPPEVLAKLDTEQPRELEIMFPVDDPVVIFPQSYKAYKGSGRVGSGVLWCVGDGLVARRVGDDGKRYERDCPCELLDEGKCKPVGTLNLMLPWVPGIGVWQINTSNRRSIVSLNSDLDMYRGLFGGLRGIPFTLRLVDEPGERWDAEAGKMKPHTYHVLKLGTKRTIGEIVEWRKALGKPVEMLMLPPGLGNAPRDADETEPDDDELPHDEGPVEWDVSYCYAQVKKLGVEADRYTRYLTGLYISVDAMTPKALAEQRGLIEGALAHEARRAAFLKDVAEIGGARRK